MVQEGRRVVFQLPTSKVHSGAVPSSRVRSLGWQFLRLLRLFAPLAPSLLAQPAFSGVELDHETAHLQSQQTGDASYSERDRLRGVLCLYGRQQQVTTCRCVDW